MQRAPRDQFTDLTPTRKSLLGRLKDRGDEKSWRDFFETYWGFIYHAAVRTGLSASEAEDVVQEVLIEVTKTIDRFEHRGRPGSFRSWLSRLVGWKIADRLRKRSREQAVVCLEGDGVSPEEGVEVAEVADPNSINVVRTLDEAWEMNLLHLAVQRVKEKVDARKFQIFDLCVLKEWPAAKVAETFGIRSAVVHDWTRRVREALDKEIMILRSLQEKEDRGL
jgi:RNA polymerase sigma-70 factor (ECF subfamily)